MLNGGFQIGTSNVPIHVLPEPVHVGNWYYNTIL